MSGANGPRHAGIDWRRTRFAVWFGLCLAAGAVLSWIAHVAQRNFAPLILFPLLAGAALGAVLVAAMRLSQMGNTRAALVGAIMSGLALAAGQHYLAFRQFEKAAEAKGCELGLAAAAFPELAKRQEDVLRSGLRGFFERQMENGRTLGTWRVRGAALWAWWIMDAMLSIAMAVALVRWAAKQPYCNSCGTWYRTIRGGKASPQAADAIFALTGVSRRAQSSPAVYRLLACRQGCGPARLELRWADGSRAEVFWLSRQNLLAVMGILDHEVAT